MYDINNVCKATGLWIDFELNAKRMEWEDKAFEEISVLTPFFIYIHLTFFKCSVEQNLV